MTALALRASHALLVSPVALLGRVFSAVAMVIDVYAEAQRLATEAHRKLPFCDW